MTKMPIKPMMFIITAILFLSPLSYHSKALAINSCTQIYEKLNSKEGFSQSELSIIESYISDSLNLVRTLTEDHKKLLIVYYRLKQQSSTPNIFYNPLHIQKSPNINSSATPTLDYLTQEQVSSISELNWKEYLLFQNQIDQDPMLENNLFLKLFKQYGHFANRGATNDIMQRVGFYLEDKYGFLKSQNPKLRITLLSEISQNVMGIALTQAKIDFNQISQNFGYIHNQANGSEFELNRWQQKLNAAITQIKNQP